MIAVCVCLVVIAAVWMLFSPVVTSGAAFVDRDDRHYVDGVGRLWSPSWEEAGNTFRRVHYPSGTSGYYQPLTALSLMLDAWLTTDWASRAFTFHLTNLLLHVVNVTLVFVLVRRLSDSTMWAILCALLFGLHPVQVESVAWVAQRMTLLATFFSLVALICYARHARSGGLQWLLAVTLCYAGAVLSKPTFIGLPVVFLMLDVWPYAHRIGPARGQRPTWMPLVEKLPVFVLMAACAALHYRLQLQAEPARPADIGGLELIARNVSSLVGRVFWPAGLGPFHPITGGAGPVVPGGAQGLGPVGDVAVLLLLAGAMIGAFVISRPLFVAIGGAVVLTFPALFNAPYSELLLGDQHLYAVLIVPIFVWAAWLRGRGGLLRHAWGRCLACSVAAVTVVFAVQSNNQTYVWQSSRSLYRHTIRLHPSWPRGHIGLIEAYIQEGDLDSALRHAEKAVRVAPHHPATQYYFGRVLLLHQDGRSREAIGPLRKALASDPDWIDCLYNLGVAMTDVGEFAEALVHLEHASRLRPNSHVIHMALGSAYLKVDRPASARRAFQLALKQRNHPMAHLGLAKAWAANDMPEFARRHLAAAVAQDPRSAALAARYPKLRRLREMPGFESLIDTSQDPIEPYDRGPDDAPTGTGTGGSH